MNFKKILLSLTISIIIKSTNGDGSFTFPNPIRFPYSETQGPFIGVSLINNIYDRYNTWKICFQLFLALSLPLELPEYNVFFSYNMEANYVLPQNETEFSYPPLVSKRSWDRRFIYDMLEYKLKS